MDNVPDTPETLAKWVWFNYVGIPLTEPYDKEYTRLFDRIEALNRQSFVAGLRECRRQISGIKAVGEEPPSSATANLSHTPFNCVPCGEVTCQLPKSGVGETRNEQTDLGQGPELLSDKVSEV